MRLLLITADPDLATLAQAVGVDRIFVDLESKGKQARQGHLDTVMSRHTLDDVRRVRRVISTSQVLVRVNPWDQDSPEEIRQVTGEGADVIMLPMFSSPEQIENFVEAVDGKAVTVGLLETPAAAIRVSQIAATTGLDEIYIGLNDLQIALKLDFMFESLAEGFVEDILRKIRPTGKPFGVGGVARMGGGELPGELVLGEHVRLGSSMVILSRAFTGKATTLAGLPPGLDFGEEVAKLRGEEARLRQRTPTEAEGDRIRLVSISRDIAARLRGQRVMT